MKKRAVLLVASSVLMGSFLVNKPISLRSLSKGERYIVELNGKSDVSNSEVTREYLLSNQKRLLNKIKLISSIDIDLDSVDNFTTVINAISLNLCKDDINRIKALPEVKNVYHDNKHEVVSLSNDEVKKSVEVATNNYSLGTMNRPDVDKPGYNVLVSVLDDGFFIEQGANDTVNAHEAYADNLGSLALKYNEAYFTNKKLNAGLLSKNAKRLNNKVPYYYDYAGNGKADDLEDTDVFDPSSSHGTHVSTSIAGKSSSYEGVAPYAQLSLMKVANDGGGASDTNIIRALEDSTKLGVDLISMSMGSDILDFDDDIDDSAMSTVLNSMTDSGILFNVAAGNNGKATFEYSDGYNYNSPALNQTGVIGSTACDDRVMTIANSTNDYYKTSALKFNNNYYEYSNSSLDKLPFSDLVKNSPLDYVLVPNLGEVADYENLNVEGKICVVSRGKNSFAEKVVNAQDKGAKGVIVYDNIYQDSKISMSMTGSSKEITIPSCFVQRRAYDDIVNDADKKFEIVVDSVIENYYKKQVSSSSSDGSNSALALKPEISTPGTEVTAGVIGKNSDGKYVSSYEDYTGTSMATPNYSGSLALLLSQGVSKDELVMKTMSTADPMTDNNEQYYSPRRQGAGLINISEALKTSQFIEGSDQRNLAASHIKESYKSSKIQLGFNTTGNFSLKYKIVNESATAVTYTPEVNVMIPRTVDIKNVVDEYGNDRKVESEGTTYQTVGDKTLRKFTVAPITVSPNSSKDMNIELKLSEEEKGLIASIFKDQDGLVGTYIEGYIFLTPSDNSIQKLNVPFMGFYGDFANSKVVEAFDFEKKPGEIYQSDLVNSVINTMSNNATLGLSPDYGSKWIMSGNSDASVKDVIENKKSISSFGTSIGYNTALKKVDSTNDFYVGSPNNTDVMYIQQFVLGSVATNKITLKNNSTNNVVLEDHMFDTIYNGLWDNEDKSASINSYRLTRSMIDLDFLPYGKDTYYAASRAYTIIPLYNYEIDLTTKKWNKTTSFPDGEYTMTFDYTSEASVLFGNTTVEEAKASQHKEYNLHIDSVKPTIENYEIVKENGTEYLKITANDNQALMEIKVDNMSVSPEKDSETNKYFAKIKTSLLSSDKLNLIVKDKANNAVSSSFYLSDVADLKHTFSSSDGAFSVISNDINQDVVVSMVTTDESEYGKYYELTFKSGDTVLQTTSTYKLTFRNNTSAGDKVEYMNAFYVDSNGNLVEVEVSLVAGKLIITVPNGQYKKVLFINFNDLSPLFEGVNELTGLGNVSTNITLSYHYVKSGN